MPYLPLDLDAKRKLEAIERGLSLPRHTMVGGAMDLWESVWRAWMETRDTEGSAIVDELAVCSAFGSDPRIRLALVARDFLEPLVDGMRWRVCGAAKWLFGLEGKSRGGKAASKNLLRGSKAGPQPGNDSPESGPFPAMPGPMPEDSSRLEPRLLHPAPSTQHQRNLKTIATPENPVTSTGALRAPESVLAGALPGRRATDQPAPAQEPEPARIPVVPEKPTTPEEQWGGFDFWSWAQTRRMAGNYVAEQVPRREELDRWWSNCLMTPGVTVRAMRLGFTHGFGKDDYWEPKGYPFAAFKKGWAKYVRPEENPYAASV